MLRPGFFTPISRMSAFHNAKRLVSLSVKPVTCSLRPMPRAKNKF